VPISLTPHNKVELVGCFYDIDRSLRVEVKGGAAELLQPHKVYTVKDVLDLPAWPYGRLRIVIERRHPLIEVVIEPV
jgi:hypothetical protein